MEFLLNRTIICMLLSIYFDFVKIVKSHNNVEIQLLECWKLDRSCSGTILKGQCYINFDICFSSSFQSGNSCKMDSIPCHIKRKTYRIYGNLQNKPYLFNISENSTSFDLELSAHSKSNSTIHHDGGVLKYSYSGPIEQKKIVTATSGSKRFRISFEVSLVPVSSKNNTIADLIEMYDQANMENCSLGINCTVNDNCLSVPCQNGKCLEQNNSYTCRCNDGFTGFKCETDIDDCLSNPCKHGTCSDYVNYYFCDCEQGYQGIDCSIIIDNCESDPCESQGGCENHINGYTCICEGGYTGADCSVPLHECDFHPCKHGNCSFFLNEDGYKCTCPDGYSGKNCETATEACQEIGDPCENGYCVNVDHGTEFMCVCDPGYTGVTCDLDMDFCRSSPCQNGTCVNNGTFPYYYYSCACVAGYTGKNCDVKADVCTASTCMNNGTCVTGPVSYSCKCVPGFTGKHCETNINDCKNAFCGNGTCVDRINAYTCKCNPGFTGLDCSVNINDCAGKSVCMNNGTCIDGINDFHCQCPTGLTGKRCESNIDDCRGIVCNNGGTCVDLIADFRCKCKTGYTGKMCENQETSTKQTTDLASSSMTHMELTDHTTAMTTSHKADVSEQTISSSSQTSSRYTSTSISTSSTPISSSISSSIYNTMSSSYSSRHRFQTSRISTTQHKEPSHKKAGTTLVFSSTMQTTKVYHLNFSMSIKGDIKDSISLLKSKILGYIGETGLDVKITTMKAYGVNNEPVTEVTYEINCNSCTFVPTEIKNKINVVLKSMNLQQYNQRVNTSKQTVNSKRHTTSKGPIIGGVVGATLVITLVVVVVIIYIRRRRSDIPLLQSVKADSISYELTHPE